MHVLICNQYNSVYCCIRNKWFVIGLVCGRCPDGWTTFSDSCYLFGHETLDFDDAEVMFKNMHLNMFTSFTEVLNAVGIEFEKNEYTHQQGVVKLL